MRIPFGYFLNVALLHGIIILTLWFPQSLFLPTKEDLRNAWKNAVLYAERALYPEPFAYAEQMTQAAAQQRIAQLPPALLTRAQPLNSVTQVHCPKEARVAQLRGNVFLTADINAQGKVSKVTVIEASPNAQINQRIVHNFTQARFTPAIDEHQKPAPDQIHFNWPYDCRK